MVKTLDCRSDEDVRAGLIPVMGRVFFYDDGGASRKARALKQVRSTKPEGAKQTRMRMQSTKLGGAKRPRMRAQSSKPEGAKRRSRRAGMSAANVGASIGCILFPPLDLELCFPIVWPAIHQNQIRNGFQ